MEGNICKGILNTNKVNCILLFVILMASTLAGGCGSKYKSPADPLQRMNANASTASIGDDVSLTPAELSALKSTGQVDKKISEKGMEDVVVQYKHFVRKGRPVVERASQRAEKYLTHSRKAFRDRGMPEELAYLAIVESGYNPVAMSPAGAAGAWQFMPFTGTRFGLQQDWWMDERRDPYKSAEAAADYLKKLYSDFNDWHLAIAAYNAGEGKIGRALDKTGAVSFFKLTEKNHTLDDKAQLREETKQYVPRFLAICKIMRNLGKLGFTPMDEKRVETVVRIEVRPGTDLLAMSKAVGMEWSEFYAHNAAYKRFISPTDRPTNVYLPQSRQQAARAYLQQSKNSSFAGSSGWWSYTVAKGDTWQKISQRASIPVSVLQAANRGTGNPKAGSVLLLPGSASQQMPKYMASASEKPASRAVPTPVAVAEQNKNSQPVAAQAAKGRAPAVAQASAPKAAKASTHTLQPGDNLTKVAGMYNVSVRELMAANDMEDPNRIRQGQVLRIPSAGAPSQLSMQGRFVATAPASSNSKSVAKAEAVHGASGSLGASQGRAPAKKKTYTVQAGDTLWSIARKHNVQTKDLLDWNNSDGKNTLRPGDTVVVLSDN